VITQEIVRKLFIYCEDDGCAGLHWRKTGLRSRAPAGSRAGTLTWKGYREIKVMGRVYREHRLIWLYHFGDIPEEIDHINLDRADNRVSNLRACSRSENMCNRGKCKKNKSGFKGVIHYPGVVGSWSARIGHKGKPIYLGTFESAEAAHAAYADAAKKLHGEFARPC
jgi:hypothetical protein